MLTSSISTTGSVKGEEDAEKSIFTRFEAKEAENAENRAENDAENRTENRAECPSIDLQNELF